MASSKRTITIQNVETGEIETREMTSEENAQMDALALAESESAATFAAANAKKAAVLAALADATGFTAEELREALNA